MKILIAVVAGTAVGFAGVLAGVFCFTRADRASTWTGSAGWFFGALAVSAAMSAAWMRIGDWTFS